MERFQLFCGDSADVLKDIESDSIDSIVTDPPYGISFMSQKWDYDIPDIDVWLECIRVLKPGGHLISFASSRTYHRIASSIEDAGFEIRDQLYWCYSSGMPKGQNISRAIDKKLGVQPTIVGKGKYFGRNPNGRNMGNQGRKYGSDKRADGDGVQGMATAPTSDIAKEFDDWNTQLKPAVEPMCLARKPLSEDSVAENVIKHGAGGMNIGACRIGDSGGGWNGKTSDRSKSAWDNSGFKGTSSASPDQGKFPMNLIVDDSDELMECLGDKYKLYYCAKATKKDRNSGLRDQNPHVSVKPEDLMRYLVRLVTPNGGIVLDPFMGSGSTGKAAMLEGFRFIGVDIGSENVEVSRLRIVDALKKDKTLFDLE